MKIRNLFGSQYLTTQDVDDPITVTIRAVTVEQVRQNASYEDKPVMYFKEEVHPLVLNKSNTETLCGLFGEETDSWKNKKVTLYNDHTVTMQGRRTGGIRIRPESGPGTGPDSEPF